MQYPHHKHIRIPAWILGTLCSYLMAQPGGGINVGQQTLFVPSVTASYLYDDNISIRERALDKGGDRLDDGDSDSSISTGVNLSMQHWNASTRVSAAAWYHTLRFSDRDELDDETYGVEGTAFWSRSTGDTTLKLIGSMQRAIERSQRAEDFTADLEQSRELENIGERVKRDETRAQMELNQRLITDVRGVFSYAYADYEYNLERYNDRSTHTPLMELNYQWTPKTQPYAKVGVVFTDDDGFEKSAENLFYLLGVRYSPTPKLDMDVAGGYENYKRTPSEGEDAGKTVDDSNIKWTARMNYALTRKTRATLSGRTGFGSVASPGSSSREETSVSFSLNHRLSNQLSHRASVAWRHDDYISAFPARGTTYDETKETLYYQYRIDYQTVRPWLSVFGQVGHEDGSSKIPGDSYTQNEIRLGVTARY